LAKNIHNPVGGEQEIHPKHIVIKPFKLNDKVEIKLKKHFNRKAG